MPEKRRPCAYCGVWTCARCGWQRHSASLARPELQNCRECGSTEGELRPTMHGEYRWRLCENREKQRWTLTAEFDPVAETINDRDDVSPLGEAADFYSYLLQYWGEESEPDITWRGETITAEAEFLNYLIEPMKWLALRAIPRRIEVVRNEAR